MGRSHKKKDIQEKRRSGKYECPYCDDYASDNLNSLRIHATRFHKNVTSKNLRIHLFEDGEHPACKCGCGEKTQFQSLQKGFADFVQGHHARTRENGFWTEEGLEKSAETRRQQFANEEREPWNKGKTGVQEAWNKGLTKENDDRVKAISESLQGHEVSQETREKLSKANREAWTKEMKEEQRKKRIEWLRENQLKGNSELETEFKSILEIQNIHYEEQYKKFGYLWDFYISETDALIEVHGDFYHCNPKKWDKPEYDIQRVTVNNDQKKKKIIEENDEELHIFWEHDIKNNRNEVIRRLLKITK
jgi:G:T-mismatch repair DNA endonuclease (very short patch repair protein)